MYNQQTNQFESEEKNTNIYLRILEDAMKQANLIYCEPKYAIKLDVDFIGIKELIIVHKFWLPTFNSIGFEYLGMDNHIHHDDDFPFCSLSEESQEAFYKTAFKGIALKAIEQGKPLVYGGVEITCGMEAEEVADDLLMRRPFKNEVDEDMLTNDPSMTV